MGRIVMGVVMTLLTGSFAVWGINDIFSGFGRSTLAKIGGTEIPIEQFRQTYNDRLQQIDRELGHPLPPDQASALGLDRQVLGQMIGQAGLDQRARQMGLGISDAEIARECATLLNAPKVQIPTDQGLARVIHLNLAAGDTKDQAATFAYRTLAAPMLVGTLV